MVQDVLPQIADELGISVGAAGQLVTAYAGSAPFLSAAAARFDQKRLLVGALRLFALANLGAALLALAIYETFRAARTVPDGST